MAKQRVRHLQPRKKKGSNTDAQKLLKVQDTRELFSVVLWYVGTKIKRHEDLWTETEKHQNRTRLSRRFQVEGGWGRVEDVPTSPKNKAKQKV